MKYLLAFYFAGFFLANAAVIKKYNLHLKPKDNKFEGTVTLTLSDNENADEVELDPYTYNVSKCTYTDQKSEQDLECKFQGNKITFPKSTTSGKVVLEFEGTCQKDGLSDYTTDSNEWFYVADMTAENQKIIFPCLAKEKALFEFEGDGVVMSNLENLKKRDEKEEVFLRNLTFVQGDIIKVDKSVPSLPYYRMNTSKEMGQKLKSVMEKVAELDPSLKILFTPVKNEIPIASRDVIILSNVDLKPDDSGSDYSGVSQKLADKLFQRPKGEKKTFFDSVGPGFAAMKISSATDSPFEGNLIFQKIRALEEDGFENSRSLNDLASKNEGIGNLHLYTKGTSVLYSLESICGNKNFTQGLANYVRNGNSKVNETFKGCFENKDKAGEFFKAWTDDPGYPVVHVVLNKSTQYYMNQERFLWSGSEWKGRRWIIPTDYKTKEGSRGNITLPATENSVTVTINSTTYFILDHNNKGFCRVNYDAKLWKAFTSQLMSNHTVIDPVSRMKLIDDVFSFSRSTYNFSHGIPDYVTALKLSEYLKNETDSRTLIVAFNALDFLDSALNSSYHSKFRNHMKGILDGIYNKTKDVKDSKLQVQVNQFACKYGVEECIKHASETFRKIELDNKKLSVQEKLAICSVVRNDSSKWTDSSILLSARDIEPWEKNNLLGCCRDENTLSLFLTQLIAAKNEQAFKEAVASAMNNNPDNIKVILGIIKRFEVAIKKVFGEECLEHIVQFTLPKLNSESAVTLKEIAKNLSQPLNEAVDRECRNVQLWTETKAKSVGEYFKTSRSGSGSQAKPIALALLATTLLPLANHIFHS